jgi:hypothetical protein
VRRQALGLEEDLVRVLAGEAVDLVLDARTVRGPTPSIFPVNIGLSAKPERMISCVRALVCVIQHDTWRGCCAASPRKLNTGTVARIVARRRRRRPAAREAGGSRWCGRRGEAASRS